MRVINEALETSFRTQTLEMFSDGRIQGSRVERIVWTDYGNFETCESRPRYVPRGKDMFLGGTLGKVASLGSAGSWLGTTGLLDVLDVCEVKIISYFETHEISVVGGHP